jgi:hypothetical protein
MTKRCAFNVVAPASISTPSILTGNIITPTHICIIFTRYGVMAGFRVDELRGDDLIATLVPSMSFVDRAILSDAIKHI